MREVQRARVSYQLKPGYIYGAYRNTPKKEDRSTRGVLNWALQFDKTKSPLAKKNYGLRLFAEEKAAIVTFEPVVYYVKSLFHFLEERLEYDEETTERFSAFAVKASLYEGPHLVDPFLKRTTKRFPEPVVESKFHDMSLELSLTDLTVNYSTAKLHGRQAVAIHFNCMIPRTMWFKALRKNWEDWSWGSLECASNSAHCWNTQDGINWQADVPGLPPFTGDPKCPVCKGTLEATL